ISFVRLKATRLDTCDVSFCIKIIGQNNANGAFIVRSRSPFRALAARVERINDRFDGMIVSRLNNLVSGRIVIIAHRLNDSDLSNHVISQGGWRHVALPFVATRSKDYDLGHDVWHRRKGDLLRPDACLSPPQYSKLI
ncbi:MAG: hypothetical protein WBG13_19390, partial [Pseudolabrys sp.]